MTPPENARKIETPPPPVERLLQLAGGYTLSAAIHTVAKLGIADLLSAGPRSASDLASASGCREDPLYRVLRLLAAFGVFQEQGSREFALTPVSELLRSDARDSQRDRVLWAADGFHFRMWAELTECVKTGRTAVDLLYGKPAFEYMQEIPEVFHAFNAAMTSISERLVPAVLDVYDFSGIDTLMDVAGGHGYSICEILKRYPAMKGILFDLPSVVESPHCRVCAQKLDHRCRHATGSFFDHIPPGADAYYLQHIIHDWEDDKALHILDNCRKALEGKKDGRLLAVDIVLPESSEPHPGLVTDLHMMILPGGRERTEPEFRRLFEKAGFRLSRIAATRMLDSVIEARPL